MKKIINFVCGLMIIISFLLCVFSFTYHYVTSPNLMFHVSKLTDYEMDAHKAILNNLKNQMTNEELKNVLDEVITMNRTSKDISRMINSLYKHEDLSKVIKEEIKYDLNISLKQKLEGLDFEQASLDDLVNTLSNSYLKNLFPYQEFGKLQNKLIDISYLLPISFFFFMFYLFSILMTFVLSKKTWQIICKSNFFIGFTLIAPYLFCMFFNIFKHFYYSNSYFSNFIQTTFYQIINLFGLFGISIILITLLIELIMVKSYSK